MVKFSESMRVKNLLGALSIGISDKITARAAEQVGYSGEAAAAITQLGTMPRLTIDALSHALKLSHSATVRLVAKLEGAGLIKRADSEDRREVRLLLTKSGKAVMMRILKEREQMLDEITKGMSPADLAELGRLVEPLLRRITKSQDEAIYLCRYCDEGRCPQDRCPTIPCH